MRCVEMSRNLSIDLTELISDLSLYSCTWNELLLIGLGFFGTEAEENTLCLTTCRNKILCSSPRAALWYMKQINCVSNKSSNSRSSALQFL